MWKETNSIYLCCVNKKHYAIQAGKNIVSWKALTYSNYIWNDLKNKYLEKGSHHIDSIKIL